MKSLTNPSFIHSLIPPVSVHINYLLSALNAPDNQPNYLYLFADTDIYIYIYLDVKQSNRQVYFARMQANDA